MLRYSYNHGNLFHFSTPRNMANKLREVRCYYLRTVFTIRYLKIQRKNEESLKQLTRARVFPLSSFTMCNRFCIYSASYLLIKFSIQKNISSVCQRDLIALLSVITSLIRSSVKALMYTYLY